MTKTLKRSDFGDNLLYIFEGPNKRGSVQKLMNEGKIFKGELGFTVGHIYEMHDPNNKWGVAVEVDNGTFETMRRPSPDKKDVLKKLEEQIKKADDVFVYTDLDNAGYGIAEDLYHHFKKYKKKFWRTPFTDLDVPSLERALINRTRDNHKGFANAEKRRAALDRIIGWGFSPLVRKNANGLKSVSAGRVQSIVLKILAEREMQIAGHKSTGYYTIFSDLGFGVAGHVDNKRSKDDGTFNFSKEDMEKVMEKIGKAKEAKIISYEEGTRKKYAPAPFKDSTFQVEGASVLGMSAKDIMRIGNALVASNFSSYVRTASVVIQDEKIDAIRDILKNNYDSKYFPDEIIEHVNTGKKVESGHYGIAPIDFNVTPEDVEKRMDKESAKVYELIYKRAVSSQMSPAEYDTQKLVIEIDGEQFSITGQRLTFEGYLKVYDYKLDDDEEDSGWFEGSFKEGDTIKVNEVYEKKNKTKPPRRYNETSLLKLLEKLGIGRPATRAGFLPLLLSPKKKYVELNGKQIIVTPKGLAVYEALKKFAEESILDFNYTSNMEDIIDNLGNFDGKEADEEYIKAMAKLYEPISAKMAEYGVTFGGGGDFSGGNFEKVYSEILDPFGNQKDQFLLERNSAHGKYYSSEIGSANFPDSIKVLEERCPKCNNLLISALSKSGNPYKFCSAMRVAEGNEAKIKKCDYFEGGGGKQTDTGNKCPSCGKGTVIEKETSKGIIQICSTGEKCNFSNWLGKFEKTDEKCPECGGMVIIKTVGKNNSQRKDCINKGYNVNTKQTFGCTWEGEWYNG